jgi:serine/threonine protein phosphatase PrpC
LQTDDRILLCSDGLYGVLSNTEIMTAVNEDPQDACELLVSQTISRGFEQRDNVTAVVLVCEQLGRMEQNA